MGDFRKLDRISESLCDFLRDLNIQNMFKFTTVNRPLFDNILNHDSLLYCNMSGKMDVIERIFLSLIFYCNMDDFIKDNPLIVANAECKKIIDDKFVFISLFNELNRKQTWYHYITSKLAFMGRCPYHYLMRKLRPFYDDFHVNFALFSYRS